MLNPDTLSILHHRNMNKITIADTGLKIPMDTTGLKISIFLYTNTHENSSCS